MKVYDFILLFGLATILAIGIFGITEFMDSKTKCVVSPLNYGISQLEKEYQSPVSCVCSINNNKYLPFIVTSNATLPLI